MVHNYKRFRIMPSQKKIAELLHISQATVSRALRDDRHLPLETILKVKKTAREIGHVSRRYSQRDSEAQEKSSVFRILALVGGGSLPVGGEGTILLEIIQGLIRATRNNNIDLIVKNVNTLAEAKAITEEYCNNVAGCIAILRFNEEVIGYLNSNFSCLSINHHYDELNVKVIEADQEKAFYQMFSYLYERGHRRIGFLTVPNSRTFIFRRYAGYLRACRQMGVDVNPEWVLNTNTAAEYDFNGIADRAEELFRRDGVRAFICTSGSLAKNLIGTLTGRGLRIPEDISFAAFDEVVTPLESGHMLYGAQADYERIAKTAIDILRQFSLFKDINTISCIPDFHYGNTVAELDKDIIYA